MHAIILVGGQGTRLQPLTFTRPKPILPIVDRPFLAHQLELLKKHGVTGVTFACGFLPDAIVDYFGDGKDIGIDLRYVIEPEPRDTAGGIAFAARTLEPQRLLVCNGDVLTDLDITKLIKLHEENSAKATIALTPVEDPTRYGLVRTDQQGAVLAFVEKPPIEECDTNLINAGTYVLEPSVIDMIPAEGRCNIEREVFPQLVGEGLFAFGFDGYWNDIGTIDSYRKANEDVLLGRFGDEVFSGGSWISSDAKVDPSAVVGAGSVIHSGAVVGANVDILASILLENSEVQANSVIFQAIVGEGAIVKEGQRLEPGTVVAPNSYS